MSTKTTIQERIQVVRDFMKRKKIDAIVVPTSDPHNTEYVPDNWCLRAYLSGFTGSAGTLLITQKKAWLWTDFRYWIQAAKELEGSGIELMKLGDDKVPTWTEFLPTQQTIKTVGYDPFMFMSKNVNTITTRLEKSKIKMLAVSDLCDQCWPTRPAPSAEKIFDFSVKYAGESRADKLKRLRQKMTENKIDVLLVTSLYDMAWLFNLRGHDTPCTPIFTAFTLVTAKTITLFIEPEKVSDALRKKLIQEGIKIQNYTDINAAVCALNPKLRIAYTATQTPAVLANLFPKKMTLVDQEPSFIAQMKAVKNATEIECARKARVDDGIALVRFFAWLERALKKGEDITEAGAAHILDQIRTSNPECKEISFKSIVGYNANAALCHYVPSNEHPVRLRPNGLLLVDSGGQYLGATTDVTRTVALGKVNAEMIHDYTLTLRGHLAIARQCFPEKTPGSQFDTLARMFMWNEHINFGHGTGHGIGAYLNVHEGPPGISVRCNAGFEPGIMVTNEPGIYREGRHGIRIENVILVVKDRETEFGHFCKFENLTYFPYDLALIDVKMLTLEEIKQINDYHATVYSALQKGLNTEDRAWLKNATRPIKLK